MTREDLKAYKYTQMWINNQVEYIETQKETINRLNSIVSDMPKGSRQVYDTEVDNLAILMDKFNELMKIIIKEKEKQEQIVEQINKVEFPYRNILYQVYIQGKNLVNVASEMGYEYKYMCKMNGIALNKFDNTTKKV